MQDTFLKSSYQANFVSMWQHGFTPMLLRGMVYGWYSLPCYSFCVKALIFLNLNRSFQPNV